LQKNGNKLSSEDKERILLVLEEIKKRHENIIKEITKHG